MADAEGTALTPGADTRPQCGVNDSAPADAAAGVPGPGAADLARRRAATADGMRDRPTLRYHRASFRGEAWR